MYTTIFLLKSLAWIRVIILVRLWYYEQRSRCRHAEKKYLYRESAWELTVSWERTVKWALRLLVQAFNKKEKIVAEYDATARLMGRVGRKGINSRFVLSWSLVTSLRSFTLAPGIVFLRDAIYRETLGLLLPLCCVPFYEADSSLYEDVVSGFQLGCGWPRVWCVTPSEEMAASFDEKGHRD